MFMETQMFIAVFTRAPHSALEPLVSVIPHHHHNVGKISFSMILHSTPRSSKWSFSLRLIYWILVGVCLLHHMCFFPHPSQPSRLYHRNNVRRRVGYTFWSSSFCNFFPVICYCLFLMPISSPKYTSFNILDMCVLKSLPNPCKTLKWNYSSVHTIFISSYFRGTGDKTIVNRVIASISRISLHVERKFDWYSVVLTALNSATPRRI
jgi:hypothetical protein